MSRNDKSIVDSFFSLFSSGNEEKTSLSQPSSRTQYGSYGSTKTTDRDITLQPITTTRLKPKSQPDPSIAFIEAVKHLGKESKEFLNYYPEDVLKSTRDFSNKTNRNGNCARFYDETIKMERGNAIPTEMMQKCEETLKRVKNHIILAFIDRMKLTHTIANERSKYPNEYTHSIGGHSVVGDFTITKISVVRAEGHHVKDLNPYLAGIRCIADRVIFFSAVAECSSFEDFMQQEDALSFINSGKCTYADALKELKMILTLGFQDLLLSKEPILGSFPNKESPYNIYATYQHILFMDQSAAKDWISLPRISYPTSASTMTFMSAQNSRSHRQEPPKDDALPRHGY